MLSVRIKLDVRDLRKRLGALGSRFDDAAIAALRATMEDAAAHVVRDKLSGQVLGRVSGSLARDVAVSPMVVKESRRIRGSIGTSLRYGAAHERGFRGRVAVRPHIRTITEAFGRSIDPTSVQVAAHTRMVRIVARRYLASGLKERYPRLESRLVRAATVLMMTGRVPTVGELL